MSLIIYIDYFLFAICTLTTLYLLFYSFAAINYQEVETGITRKKGRFLIITTGTSVDTKIEDTVSSVMKQDYDESNYDMVVVGNGLTRLQSMKLAQYRIQLLLPNLPNSNKVQAQQYALFNTKSMRIYDLVILLDPDETVPVTFLTELNKVLQAGIHFCQLHRKPQSMRSDAAILSNTMEEINNCIFRKGHVALGMPSSLIGSGMVFDYNWFKENINNVHQEDEEKSLESILIKQRIFVDYLDDICIYYHPISTSIEIAKQRRRWMESQVSSFINNIKMLLPALWRFDTTLLDKLYSWIMLPRIFMFSIICIMSAIIPLLYFTAALKWWGLLLVSTFCFALATPDYVVDHKWMKSFRFAPYLMGNSLYNVFAHNFIIRKLKKSKRSKPTAS